MAALEEEEGIKMPNRNEYQKQFIKVLRAKADVSSLPGTQKTEYKALGGIPKPLIIVNDEGKEEDPAPGLALGPFGNPQVTEGQGVDATIGGSETAADIATEQTTTVDVTEGVIDEIVVTAEEAVVAEIAPIWILIQYEIMKREGADFTSPYIPERFCPALNGVISKLDNLYFDEAGGNHSLLVHNEEMMAVIANDVHNRSSQFLLDAGIYTSEGTMPGHDIIRTVLGKFWVRRSPLGGNAGAQAPIVFASSGLADMNIRDLFNEARSTQLSDPGALTPEDPMIAQVKQELSWDVGLHPIHVAVGKFGLTAAPHGKDSPNKYTRENITILNETPVPTGIMANTPGVTDELASDPEFIFDTWELWKYNNDIPILETIRDRVESDQLTPSSRFKYDHVHEIQSPYSYKEVEGQNINNPLVVRVTPEYNFLNEKYESFLDEVDDPTLLPESILPHLPLMVAYEDNNDPLQMSWGKISTGETDAVVSNDHFNFLTLLREINKYKTGSVQTMETLQEYPFKKIKNEDSNDIMNVKTEFLYFDDWADAANRLITGKNIGMTQRAKWRELREKYKTQILLPREWDPTLLNQIEERRKRFPMCIKIEFTAPRSGQVMDLLRTDMTGAFELYGMAAPGLWYSLLRLYIAGDIATIQNSTTSPEAFNGELGEPVSQGKKEMDFLEFLERLEPSKIESSWNTNDETHGVHFLTSLADDPVATIVPDNVKLKTRHAINLVEKEQQPSYAPQQLIKTMDNFIPAFKKLVKEKTRTYEDILNGKLACSETLFWKITKHEVDENGDPILEPIQTFYYPNIGESNEFTHHDTQVRYGKDYVYQINAINIVFGTEYEFVNKKEEAFPILDKVLLNYSDDPQDYYNPTVVEPLKLTKNAPISYSNTEYTPGWQDWHLSPLMVKDIGTTSFSGNTKNFLKLLTATTANGWRYPTAFALPQQFPSTVKGLTGIKPFDNSSTWKVGAAEGENRKTNWALELEVITRPSVRLVEVPYYSEKVAVVDKPPLSPFISAVPYKDVDDRFLLSMEARTGHETAEPIVLRDTDGPIIEKQYVAQGSPFPPILEYRADDTPEAFEVFRIDPPITEEEILSNEASQYYPPLSFDNFRNNANYRSISAPDTSSKSLIEEIEPNLSYYYTFRTVDYHDNISNPSVVYEIKIVNDGGATYLLIKLYEFPKLKRRNTKPMKRYLNVAPAIEQVIRTNTLDPNSQNILLGTQDESVFDTSKSFKIRLTSKKTGKKIDLNVKFDIKNNITSEEQGESS